MPDGSTPAAATAPSPVPAVVPAVETPSPSPAGGAAATPEPAAAPVESTATPGGDAKPASSLLGDGPAVPEPAAAPAKVEDPTAAPAAEKPADTAAPVEAPAAEPITYKPFTFREGFAPDPTQVSAFTEIIQEARVPQEVAQKLVSFYESQVEKASQDSAAATLSNWNSVRDNWRKEITEDPEIGGNRLETSVKNAKSVLSTFGGADGGKSLREALNITGMGDNPEMLRFVSRVAKALGEGRPVPATAPQPRAPANRAQRRYAGNKNA